MYAVITVGFGPLRFLSYIMIISILLSVNLFYHIIKSINKTVIKVISIVLLSILIFAIFINSIFILYPSPYTVSSSYHTTKSKVDGMGWILSNMNKDIEIASLNIQAYRYVHLLFNIEDQKSFNMINLTTPYNKIPYHFADNDSSLSTYYIGSIYLVTTSQDISIYEEVVPEMAKYRFTIEDFKLLNDNINLDKIYTNNEFNLWFIR
jgi:hypothetical protein